jgi:small subunit ribosomal protein S4
MGSPKRNRKQYDRPKDMWNLQRINADNEIKEEFGLKNMKELWKVQSELSRIRSNVRMLLSGTSDQNTKVQENILTRLSKYGIATKTSTLDNLLDLKENAFLSRRLQSLVFKRGLAKTIKQSRQLIVHGYISIGGKRVNRPGYLVSVDEESKIGYYKPIDIAGVKQKSEAAQTAPEVTAPTTEEVATA